MGTHGHAGEEYVRYASRPERERQRKVECACVRAGDRERESERAVQ